MEFLKSILNAKFLISIYGGIIFAFLFASFFDFQLTENSNFLIGEATSYGVDIGARIQLTYLLIFCGLIFSLTSYFILRKFFENKVAKLDTREIKSLLGITIIFAVISLPSPIDSTSFLFLNLILGAAIFIQLQDQNLLNSKERLEEALNHLAVLIVLFALFQNWIVVGAVALIQLWLILSKTNHVYINLLSLSICALPVTSILGVELSMILNQREIYVSSFLIIIALFVLIAVLFFIWRKTHLKSSSHRLYKVQLPLLIVSLSAIMFYAPIQNWHTEMFEMANELNPVMLSVVYDKLPIFDFISSHLFSDFTSQMIYVILNGYNNSQDPMIYKWIPMIFSVLISYYFLKSVIGEKILLAAIIVFLPFTALLLPSTFGFALLPILVLQKYFQTKKSKFLWFYVLLIGFIALWRVDLGVGIIAASICCLPLVYIFEKDSRRSLIKVFLVSVSFILAGVLILNFNRPGLIAQMRHYFGASQAHGIHVLAFNESNLFYLDYFIIPFVILLILILLFINRKKWNSDTFFYPMLILIGFYFFNIQRGLVRHSFIENNETMILSFAYLIIFIFVYRFLNFKKSALVFSSLMILGFFVSIHISANWNSLLDSDKNFSITKLPKLEKVKIQRTINKPPLEHDELVSFLRGNLARDETFLDFSNTPILYFYAEKQVPSIFCQYLQNTVDGFLQDENLKSIQKQKIPFVVFNHVPRGFFDASDGIPNEVRYYRTAAHIYKNYKPYKIIGGYSVWVEKESKLISELDPTNETEQWFLGQIPLRWKREKQQTGFVDRVQIDHNKTSFLLKNVRPNDFLRMRISSQEENNLILRSFLADTIKFECHMYIAKGEFDYFVPIGTSYNANNIDSLIYKFESTNKLKLKGLKISHLK